MPKSKIILLLLSHLLFFYVGAQEINNEFVVPDKNASPREGYNAFYAFIQQNIVYPREAIEASIEGNVHVQFVVEESGVLTNIKTVKDIGSGCGDEAERIIQKYENWNPAEKDGQAVKAKIELIINFSLKNVYQSPNNSVIEKPLPHKKFPGFQEWFDRNLRFTSDPVPINNINSNVEFEFYIDTSGAVKNITISKSLGKYFDNEIVTILNSMPPWTPAKSIDGPVDYLFTLSIKITKTSFHNASIALSSFNQGNDFFDRGKYEKAFKQYTKAIEKDPEPMSYHYNKAMTLLKLSKVQEGCQILSKLKDMDRIVKESHDTFCL